MSSLIPVLMVLAANYAGLTILSRYPHLFNYPWKITEENAERQYRLARTMMSWLKAELVWIFAYTVWSTIRMAHGEAAGLGEAFIPAMLIVVFWTMGIYLWIAARAR